MADKKIETSSLPEYIDPYYEERAAIDAQKTSSDYATTATASTEVIDENIDKTNPSLSNAISSSTSVEDEVRNFLINHQEFVTEIASKTEKLSIDNILGMPFKFSKADDMSALDLSESALTFQKGYGRLYLEQFLEWGNIITFSPGIAQFLPGVGDKMRKFIENNAFDSDSSEDDEFSKVDSADTRAKLAEAGAAKMYEFAPATNTYWNYVNMIWRHLVFLSGLNGKVSRLAAYYMQGYEAIARERAESTGIDYSIASKYYLDNINWKDVTSDSKMITNLLYGRIGSDYVDSRELTSSFVSFYHDGAFGSAEGYNTTVGESIIGAKINSIPGEDIVRELSFLSGSTYYDQNNYNKNSSDQARKSNSELTKVLSSKQFGVKTVVPEVWKDSGSSKEYQFTIKTATVSGSPESYLLNAGRTLAHVLAMSLPIHKEGNASYGAPLIVRVYCKGLPNVDLGMITGVNVTKNISTISSFGLACDMTITITLRDLTSVVALPSNKRGVGAATAIGYMNMIGGLTGANVHLVDWAKLNIAMNWEDIKSYQNIITNVKDAIKDMSGSIANDIANSASAMTNKLGQVFK